MARLSLWVPVWLAFGCVAKESKPVLESIDPAIRQQAVRHAAVNRIAWLEDRREDSDSELERLSLSEDRVVRRRATRALGRMPFPELGGDVTYALLQALKDSDADVRALAAFGLGLRADPASTQGLLAAWNDPNEVVRASLVEAASRFDDPALREEVLYALADPSPRVRAEAATAPHRWNPKDNAAAVIDSALANVAAKAPAKLRRERWGTPDEQEFQVTPEDDEVIWRALFSLERRKSERGREVFYLWCRAPDHPLARLFATRGLAALDETTLATREALRECLEDEDWRVAVEAAVGLGRFPEPTSVPALERALAHPNVHVRTSAALALGSFINERLQVKPILDRRLVDVSPNVRAAAIRSLAQIFRGEIAADLEVRAGDHEPMVRKAVALSCQYLPADAALPLLKRLIRDTDSAVAYAATQGLGPFLAGGGRQVAHGLLASQDNGLRLGAVMALQEAPSAEDLEPLLRCFSSSDGDISDEIRAEILKTAAKLEDDRALEILLQGARANRPFTRDLGRRLLAERFPKEQPPAAARFSPRGGEVPPIDLDAPNPRVEVSTTRGTMVFELLVSEAPLHAHNFLTLARDQAYDGLLFHRVVADFVAQGGDYRGDGNGGTPWRGEALRHEFNEHKYIEGSLGMPRNDDPDSGGSQFFITHRPTPHLDGRYTLFGRLVQGHETLREIEEGDRILEVRVRGESFAKK